jgi:hypothetical protein
MTPALSVVGGLTLAAMLFASVQFIGAGPKHVEVFQVGVSQSAPVTAATRDVAWDPIEDLAAWPASARR